MRRTFLLLFSCLLMHQPLGAVPTPSEFLKMQIGADRVLADYKQMTAYFRALDEASPRLTIQPLGKTTLGEEMLMLIISSEENIANLESIRETSRKLADPRNLSDQQIDELVKQGKTVVLVTCNIHATEIASTQMALEWSHALVTAEDEETKRRLDNVVLLLVPSLNPDGQLMEVQWYRKQLGTEFEGSSMPWLYHHYVGHDNNRDWFMLTQLETRNLTRAIYHKWFPQLFIDEHQMGSNGPRMFIPPFADPVDPDVHPLIWREVNLIGSMMALRLEQREKAGVIYGYAYDAYWIGGTRNTGWWKNITGMLLEIASAHMATPIYVEPSELSGGRKGLIDYKAQTNHPNPWKGGWWRMRDIMDYERIASDALLEVAANRREDFLRNLVTRARTAIASAKPGEAYRIPAAQRDYPYDVATWTLPLMMGVTVERTTLPPSYSPARVEPPLLRTRPASGNKALPKGELFSISAGSAASARIVNKALEANGSASFSPSSGEFLLERHAASAVSSLAESLGVNLVAVDDGSKKERTPLRRPRVATYKPWAISIDEGWTRWLLEQNGFAPGTLSNEQIRSGKLSELNVIILPDIEKEVMDKGKEKPDEGAMRYFAEPPSQYKGGLDKSGAKSLNDFVKNGGMIIAFDSASEYVMEHFNVPVRNALAKVKSDDFYVPGSLLRIELKRGHPVTAGMPETVAAFVDEKMAFDTEIPGQEMTRWVLATYPERRTDILLSGWIAGEDKLTRKAAAVAMTYGKGKIVLFGFRPQHRAQTHATFPLLFNAIYWSVVSEAKK